MSRFSEPAPPPAPRTWFRPRRGSGSGPARTTQSARRRLLFSAAALFLAAALVELGSRAMVAMITPEVINPLELTGDPLGYRLTPGFASHGFAVTSQGFVGTREYSRRIPRGRKRVVVIGDSLTQGDYRIVAYPAVLAAALATAGAGDWEVINAGVSGYNHEQCRLRLEQVLAAGWETDLVIYGVTPNDILPRLAAAAMEALRTRAGSGLLKRLVSFRIMVGGADAILARCGEPPLFFARRKYTAYCALVNRSYRDPERCAALAASLAGIRALGRDRGCPVLFITLPQSLDYVPGPVRDSLAARQQFYAAQFPGPSAPVFDATALFTADGVFSAFVPGDPVHLNSIGHRRLAARLAPLLMTDGRL